MAQKYKLLGFSSSGYTHDISALRLENYADQIDYMVFTGGNSSYNPAYVYDRKKGMQNIEGDYLPLQTWYKTSVNPWQISGVATDQSSEFYIKLSDLQNGLLNTYWKRNGSFSTMSLLKYTLFVSYHE